MLVLPKSARAGVTIETHTLDEDEWYFVIALQGSKQDAPFEKIEAYRELKARLSDKEQEALLHRGYDKLVERGFIAKKYDDEGNPVMRWDVAEQKLVHVDYIVGKLVTRLSTVDPHKSGNWIELKRP